MIAALMFAGLAAAQPAPALPEAVNVGVLSGSPQAAAQAFLGPTAAGFREIDLIMLQPTSIIRGVVLFKTPVAASPGVCSVEVVSIVVDQDFDKSKDLLLRPRQVRTERRHKLVAGATDDQCRGLATAKDFFVVEGDDAVALGAEPFRRAISEARSKRRLSFQLTCGGIIGARSADCAAKGRKALARMDPGKIGSVRPCQEPVPGKSCYAISYDPPKMMNGQAGWSIEVVSAAGKTHAVRLERVIYPVV